MIANGKGQRAGREDKPHDTKTQGAALSDVTVCTGRTRNLAGMYEEVRMSKRHLQWVQIIWMDCILEARHHLKAHSPGPSRKCPSAEIKVLGLQRQIMDEQT